MSQARAPKTRSKVIVIPSSAAKSGFSASFHPDGYVVVTKTAQPKKIGITQRPLSEPKEESGQTHGLEQLVEKCFQTGGTVIRNSKSQYSLRGGGKNDDGRPPCVVVSASNPNAVGPRDKAGVGQSFGDILKITKKLPNKLNKNSLLIRNVNEGQKMSLSSIQNLNRVNMEEHGYCQIIASPDQYSGRIIKTEPPEIKVETGLPPSKLSSSKQDGKTPSKSIDSSCDIKPCVKSTTVNNINSFPIAAMQKNTSGVKDSSHFIDKNLCVTSGETKCNVSLETKNNSETKRNAPVETKNIVVLGAKGSASLEIKCNLVSGAKGSASSEGRNIATVEAKAPMVSVAKTNASAEVKTPVVSVAKTNSSAEVKTPVVSVAKTNASAEIKNNAVSDIKSNSALEAKRNAADTKSNVPLDNKTSAASETKSNTNLDTKSNSETKCNTASEAKTNTTASNNVIGKRKSHKTFLVTWAKQISSNGYARCLIETCNFISLEVQTMQDHYKICDGLQKFETNSCKSCKNWLSTEDELAIHEIKCKAAGENADDELITSKENDRVIGSEKKAGVHKDVGVTPSSERTAVSEVLKKKNSLDKVNSDVIQLSDKIKQEHSDDIDNSNTEKDSTSKRRSPDIRATRIMKRKPNEGFKEACIIQPCRVIPKGEYVRRRAYTKKHKAIWETAIQKYRHVKCIYQNCHFLALSVQDMISHFGYCNGDGSYAKFVCPYCDGRVTSELFLEIHMHRSHPMEVLGARDIRFNSTPTEIQEEVDEDYETLKQLDNENFNYFSSKKVERSDNTCADTNKIPTAKVPEVGVDRTKEKPSPQNIKKETSPLNVSTDVLGKTSSQAVEKGDNRLDTILNGSRKRRNSNEKLTFKDEGSVLRDEQNVDCSEAMKKKIRLTRARAQMTFHDDHLYYRREYVEPEVDEELEMKNCFRHVIGPGSDGSFRFKTLNLKDNKNSVLINNLLAQRKNVEEQGTDTEDMQNKDDGGSNRKYVRQKIKYSFPTIQHRRRKVLKYYTKTWTESIKNYGFARCLVATCNFISLDIFHIQNHFKTCDGVPADGPNLCTLCCSWLPSAIELSMHSSTCQAFNEIEISSTPMADSVDKDKDETDENAKDTDMQSTSKDSNDDLNGTTEAKYSIKSSDDKLTDSEDVENKPSKENAAIDKTTAKKRRVSSSLRISDLVKLKKSSDYDMLINNSTNKIIQRRPVLPKGQYLRRRSYNKQHRAIWESALEKHKYVKCIFQNCHFLAMSVEDMIYHFGYCIGDGSFAKFECPHCGGRLTTKEILDIHVKVSHNQGAACESKSDSPGSCRDLNSNIDELVPHLSEMTKLYSQKEETDGKHSKRPRAVKKKYKVTDKMELHYSSDSDSSSQDVPMTEFCYDASESQSKLTASREPDVFNDGWTGTENDASDSLTNAYWNSPVMKELGDDLPEEVSSGSESAENYSLEQVSNGEYQRNQNSIKRHSGSVDESSFIRAKAKDLPATKANDCIRVATFQDVVDKLLHLKKTIKRGFIGSGVTIDIKNVYKPPADDENIFEKDNVEKNCSVVPDSFNDRAVGTLGRAESCRDASFSCDCLRSEKISSSNRVKYDSANSSCLCSNLMPVKAEEIHSIDNFCNAESGISEYGNDNEVTKKMVEESITEISQERKTQHISLMVGDSNGSDVRDKDPVEGLPGAAIVNYHSSQNSDRDGNPPEDAKEGDLTKSIISELSACSKPEALGCCMGIEQGINRVTNRGRKSKTPRSRKGESLGKQSQTSDGGESMETGGDKSGGGRSSRRSNENSGGSGKEPEPRKGNTDAVDNELELVTCAKCGAQMRRKHFQDHNLRKHVGLSWIVGDEPVDLDDEETVKRQVKQAFKFVKNAKCEKCESVKRSALGFISHVQNCGKSEEEKEALKIQCPYCPSRILKYSLPVHLKLSHPDPASAKTDDGASTSESASTSGILTKRRSAIDAVNRFQEVFRHCDDDDDDNSKQASNYVMYEKGVSKLPRLPRKIQCLWSKMQRENKRIPCRRGSCLFDSSTLQEAKLHHFMCSELPDTSFVCQLCDFYAATEDVIRQHVVIHSKGDADTVEFSEDEKAEANFDIQEDMDIDESLLEPELRIKTYDGSCFENSVEASYRFNFFAREMILNERTKPFYVNTLRMTLFNEIKESSVAKASWPDLQTCIKDWGLVPLEHSEKYLPSLLESISFQIAPNATSWLKIQRFQGDIVEGTPLFFTGGSILSMSWCKVSCVRAVKERARQYLAVSSSKKMDKFQDIHERREDMAGIVQIWDCGWMNFAEKTKEIPKMVMGIAHDSGEIWDLSWYPFDSYAEGTVMKYLTRLGLLGGACQDGTVKLWSVCSPDQLISLDRVPLYKVEPRVILELEDKSKEGCLRLAIGQTGIIIGGYANGLVAVWTLSNIESPFCKKIGESRIIKPHLSFQAHRTSITALSICPNSDRYIATAGLDRIIKFWDLECVHNPFETVLKEVCTDNIWPRLWPVTISAMEDTLCGSSKIMVKSIRDAYSDKHCAPFPMESTCWGLSFSEWMNALCACNSVGEVKMRYLRNMYLSDEYLRSKTSFTLSSTELRLLNPVKDNPQIITSDGGNESTGMKKSSKKLKDNAPIPRSYEEASQYFGLIFNDNKLSTACKKSGNSAKKRNELSVEEYPITSINKVAWNPNFDSFNNLAIGHHCGLIRIVGLMEGRGNEELNRFCREAYKVINTV